MCYDFVRLIGLEPTRLATLDPKSSAATNYATGASRHLFVSFALQRYNDFLELQNFWTVFF